MGAEAGVGNQRPGIFSDRILTVPNVITVVRLCLLPVFVWLLLVQDEVMAAAVLLGLLGATDWVDGYIARRYDQGSELGKVLDPVADRLLFIVGIVAIIISGGVPLWYCLLVLVREVLVGAAMLVATMLGMERFPVTIWGKAGTFCLMWSFPYILGSSAHGVLWPLWWIIGWGFGIPGLVLSYYSAWRYVPTIRANLAAGRAARKEHR